MIARKGFVLVMVLWMMVILTVAASFFALWTGRAVEQTAQLQKQLQASIDLYNTRSTLLYLLTTQPFEQRSLVVPSVQVSGGPAVPEVDLLEALQRNDFSPEDLFTATSASGFRLQLDDRAWQGLGGAHFALQDETGLIGLNRPDAHVLKSLFTQLHIPPEKHDQLYARLKDYIDRDELHEINGAEKAQYLAIGQRPPTNRPLLGSMEVLHIPGWPDALLPAVRADWQRLTTVQTYGSPNLNTAPAEVLQAWYGLTSAAVEQLLIFRQTQDITGISQLTTITQTDFQGIDESLFTFFPLGLVRLTLWHKDVPQMQQYHIRIIAQLPDKAPWQYDQLIHNPLDNFYAGQTVQIVPTPLLTDQQKPL